MHQGWVGARSCRRVAGTTIQQCPGPSPGSSDGAGSTQGGLSCSSSIQPHPWNHLRNTLGNTSVSAAAQAQN